MKRTFEQWEIQKGLFAYDLSRWNTSKDISEDEFDSITQNNLSQFHGVDYKIRVNFLKINGYDVTRDNLINPELSAKPVEQ